MDIDPDAGVKQAMNQIQVQERLKVAAEAQGTTNHSLRREQRSAAFSKTDSVQRTGEAQRIIAVKGAQARADSTRIEAEADADKAYQQGHGLSRQRQAIIDGLAKSVSAFQTDIPGVNAGTVLDLVLVREGKTSFVCFQKSRDRD